MGALLDRLKQAISMATASAVQAARRRRAAPLHERSATATVGLGRPEPKTPTIAEIAKRVVRDLKREHGPFARILRAWEAVGPPEAAGQTQVLNYQHGRLEIGVRDASLRAELQSFRRLELTEALRAREDGRDVAEIRFRLIGAAPAPSGRGAQEGAGTGANGQRRISPAVGAPRPAPQRKRR
jgi:hypothetical protein